MHVGELVKSRLKADKKSVVWLAKELGCHRSNIYNLMNKQSIDSHILARLSVILNHNFFDDLKKAVDEKLNKNQC